ncbi:ATP-grasp domain-containing protein [Fusobacterium ulcerans]|uniref:ATP-grasp domain-containing protein n=1 Tax=Fusobacterium ulcerans TaxID=861 RepID=UPI0030B17C88
MEYIGLIAGKSGDSLTEEIQKKGYKVALVVGKEKEPGYDIADKVLVTDLSNQEEIYKFFSTLQVKYLIVGTGHIVVLRTIKYLEKKGIKLSIDLEKTFLCKDKYLFKKEIEKTEYLTPKYILFKKESNQEENIKEILTKFEFPIVLKSPIDKREPIAVNNISELKEYYENIKKLDSDILIEEYISGSDVTVPVVSNKVDINALGILYWSKGKVEFLKGFENSKSYKLNNEEEVLKKISCLIKDLGIIGLSRADIVVKDNGEIYILEVNSIIVCGNTGSIYNQLWQEQGFNFAKITVENALKVFEIGEEFFV